MAPVPLRAERCPRRTLAAMSLNADLVEITGRYAIPEAVLEVFRKKAIISVAAIVKTFEDDEQFVDFVLDDAESLKTLRLKMALKMVYFDSWQRSMEGGNLPRPPTGGSPGSSSAGSREPSEPGDEEKEEEEASSDGEAPPGEPGDNRPRWR
mmetsp:Transcript_103681/g.309700  ORF Transcript_103681/g.309700 Transcript_103681/m.309700 type:complete len:152 (+) Transcript_103681:2-457(+)